MMNSISTKKCRLCNSSLSTQPNLKLENVPRGVHDLLTFERLGYDVGVDIEVYQCNGCGLVQLAGEAIIYDDQLGTAHAFSPGMVSHRKQQAHNFVGRFNLTDKKVVEIGCGDGHFLALLSEAGAKPFGIEPSKKSTQIGREKGLPIQEGYLNKTSEIEGTPFDAFVILHVLEHLLDPNEFLQTIYQNLTTNAVGFVEVPSLEKILENQRVYDFITEHLSYFSIKTLRFALEKNGFEVLDIQRDWGGEHLVAMVQKQPLERFDPVIDCINSLTKELVELVDTNSSAGKRVAIWGASTHGITLLSLTKLKGLAYVVDSSPYKQGFFTPISHLAIVAPDRLKTDPVDTVIVMAPRFSDEIVGQLRTELQFTGTIAVIKGTSLEFA
jgi:SAM-dependent methyltransferase